MKYLYKITFCLLYVIIETKEVKIWGPGLDPRRIVLPARYFFVDTFQTSVSSNFSAKVSGLNLDQTRPCRIWTNILDRKNGSYIVRYKLFETCNSLKIVITYGEYEIKESPIIINALVYAEKCNCPSKSLIEFITDANCGDVPNQIHSDLKIFKEIDWNLLRNKVINAFDKPLSISICHYIVKDNKAYRKCYGKHVGFKMFMDNILLSLLRKIKFPDIEFFINLGDWPLVRRVDEILPVFSWSGSKDTLDMVLPTYDITESTLENMGRVMLDMLSVQGNIDKSWSLKIPKVFWRGRDSNPFRLKLIDISRQYPELFNASITNFFFYKQKEAKYGPKSPHVSFYKFFDYKYQVSIDGTVASYRLPYLLAGDSLVFKSDSSYYEHFYNKLQPGIHYIPIKEDLSNLIEKIKWALGHDKEVQNIISNAQLFSNEHLLPKNIFCYHAFMFNEFYQKIVSDIEIQPGMEQVEQPEDVKDCGCQINYLKDEL